MLDLNILFGVPEHGWLPVTVRTGDLSVSEDVSDVPIDSLRHLIRSLISLYQCANDGPHEEVIEWHLEPDVWEWILHAEGDDLRFGG